MKNAVTYSLASNSQNSEEYYSRVRNFTDEVIDCALERLAVNIKEFKEYVCKFHLEEPRSDEEYILELLSFGILWKHYSRYSLTVRRAPFVTMSRMAEWRKRHQKLKPIIDLLRGVLITLFLFPDRGKHTFNRILKVTAAQIFVNMYYHVLKKRRINL